MGIRRKGRILAVQALYSWDLSKKPEEELLDFDWVEGEDRKDEVIIFASLMVQGFLANQADVDAIIKKYLVNWEMERLAKVDLAILRLSVYSLLFQKDIPSNVTINEGVEIAKSMGSDESYRFVNGILDSIHNKEL